MPIPTPRLTTPSIQLFTSTCPPQNMMRSFRAINIYIPGGDMYKFALAALCAAAFNGNLFAFELDVNCATQTQPVTWEYCITKSKGSTNPDVVYHLHGAGENARSWSALAGGKKFYNAWEIMNKDAPTVVSVSFGDVWLLASRNAKPTSGLYDLYIQHVIPYIESHDLKGFSGRRLLFGYSMGGYNGSQVFLKNPEMFKKVVLGCPAMSKVSPFASKSEVDDYIKRTKADPASVQFMLDVVKSFYESEPAYMQDSPLVNADKQLNASFPELHLSCGDTDGFGFHEGAKLFSEIAQSHGVNMIWQSLSGGHCVLDETSIAEFLTK